jgi:hypothetical protein
MLATTGVGLEGDRMAHSYLIRHGLMGRVGRFVADSAGLPRGQTVVIRSPRGTELGSVLLQVAGDETSPLAQSTPARVLRVAGPEDLELARRVELDRPRRFEACRHILQDGVWPFELIDVEPMLDDRRTVLHYLGPHRFDTSGLYSAILARCELDVYLEPVGLDVPDAGPPDEAEDPDHGCGHCGTGGSCGTGGCGAESSRGGCSGCSIKELLARTRRMPAAR